MAKDYSIDSPISPQQFDDIRKAKVDPFYFSNFIYVIHPIRGKVKFDLYEYQKSVLWHFLTDRFNIILKFRQAGITELISLYALWLAMFHPNKIIVIISIKDRVAKKVLRKIKYMYKNLPDHMKINIVNGRSGEYGTACITGDTEIVGENNNFRIDSIVPPYKGIADVSHLNLKVLTHEGNFKRVTKTINKGTLETWEITNNKNKTLKCTPDHRVYTTNGWVKVKDAIKQNEDVIFFDNKPIEKLEKIPITRAPKKEIIKETRYPGYYVSNLGKVYSKRQTKLKELKQKTGSHCRVKLRNANKFVSVHRLVWETFKGNIPDGFVVDHINCNRFDNYLNNLQCITYSKNTKRAYTYNRSLKLRNYFSSELDTQQIGKLKTWDKSIGNEYGDNKELAEYFKLPTKRISQLRRQKELGSIYTSKITKVRDFKETIYDLEVEGDHSYITSSDYINHNTDMEFSNGSIISSVPTTEDAGRSEAVSLLVIDEAAIVRWANQIWAAAFPTLSTGGSAIVNSTPYGVGNWFHQQWVDAVAGGNDFNAIRLKWPMHPERDIVWYEQMAKSLGKRRTAQEIDGDFLTSGHTVFDLDDIKAIEDLIPEQTIVETRYNGQLRIFEKPKKGTYYYIGGDISTGRSQDYSAFSIMDRFGDEVGCFKGKISVDKMADLMMELGYEYNNATLAPESNDIGLAVTNKIQTSNYPNLYYSTKLLRKKGKRRPETEQIPGWLTTSKNRPVIIDELEQDIRNEDVFIKDPFFVQEAYTFIYDASNRPVALGKGKRGTNEDVVDGQTYTDDSIMAKAITNFIRKGKQQSLIVSPK